jgi:immune inhibitor A
MAADAALKADPQIDFTNYDNDHDGYVDAFVVVHAGTGAEETGNPNDIWSHKWLLPKVYNADATKIYGYLTVPEDCKLGVCAHELGHLLFGFPDLYDTELPGEGIGDWCLMSGGSWNNGGLTPAHPCAWCKMQQNWVTTANQTMNEKSVVIEDVKKSKKIFRLWKDGGPGTEYFLIENRQLANYDKYLPAPGLLIFHVDDAIEDNSNEAHYKVALMQADGKKQLEAGSNRGDGGDPWPGSSKNKDFTNSSTPASTSYGGLDTLVQVKNIKTQSGDIIADLYVKTGDASAAKKKKKKKATKKAKKKK